MLRKIFVLLLFCTVVVSAVTLTDEKLKYDDFTLHYFYDESNLLDIQDIEKQDFRHILPSQFSQGYYTGTSWFKIDLKNQSKNKDFILYFTEPLWTKLDLYTKKNRV